MRFEKGKFGLSAKGECVECKKKKLKIFEEVQEEEFFEEAQEEIVDKKVKKKNK